MDLKAAPTHGAPRLYFDTDSGCWRRYNKTTSRPVTMMTSGGEKKFLVKPYRSKEKSAFQRLPDEIIEQ